MTRSAFGAVVVIAVCAWSARADDAEMKRAVKALAEKIATATVKDDHESVFDLTHPKVIELAGGRDKAVEASKTLLKRMKDAGITILDVKIGEPADPVRGGKEVFVVVPTTLEMNSTKGKGTVTGYLLGVSANDGKTWRFVDGAYGSAEIRKMFPDLPKSVTLPKTEYKLVKD